jgi:hypothetical protein
LSFRPPRGEAARRGAFLASLARLRLRGWGFPFPSKFSAASPARAARLACSFWVVGNGGSAGPRRRTGLKILGEQERARARGWRWARGLERAGKIWERRARDEFFDWKRDYKQFREGGMFFKPKLAARGPRPSEV